MLNYELTIPLGYSGDTGYDERNLQSNHTPENEVTSHLLVKHMNVVTVKREK